jgi:hypothetical protein
MAACLLDIDWKADFLQRSLPEEIVVARGRRAGFMQVSDRPCELVLIPKTDF